MKEVAVEIAVGDTGCGIEPSKLENIFREFEQVESSMPRSSNLPGLGTKSHYRHWISLPKCVV